MEVSSEWLLYILIPAVEFLYASVGHGGASGYLALMALFHVDPSNSRTTAMIMNIFVSAVAFYQYYKTGYMRWQLFLWLIVGSLPLALAGSMLTVNPSLYMKILGFLLLIPVIRLLLPHPPETGETQKLANLYLVCIGAIIGFLSGLIGIGDGILLSPLLLLLKVSTMKQTAAISALFVAVNSVTGFIGVASKGLATESYLYVWLALALIGGSLGAYFGTRQFSFKNLKLILAVVLAIASFKLLFS
jgi:hypothetical protein